MGRQKGGNGGGYSPVKTTDLDVDELLPDDDEQAPPRWPRASAVGCLSAATFQWVTPIFKLGMRRQVRLQLRHPALRLLRRLMRLRLLLRLLCHIPPR